MGQFFTISLGRNPHQAFDNAVKDAFWEHGHGEGNTDNTIVTKDGFKYVGRIPTPHWQRVPGWFERELAKKLSRAVLPQHRLPGKEIPPRYRQMVRDFTEVYENESGPAICYEVIGRQRLAIKEERGRSQTWDHVYVFCGRVTSTSGRT